MEVLERKPRVKSKIESFEEDFKPTGAIAFFVALIILGLIIWFGIFFLMLSRT
jgi:hypothetical protein